MPSEIGGKKFATDFKSMIEKEVAKALEEGRGVIRQATQELKDAIKEQSAGAARVIRQEAKHIRDSFEEYTGNNPPDDELEREVVTSKDVGKVEDALAEGKPDPTLSQSGGGTAS